MTWDPRTPRLHTTVTPQDTRGPARLWSHPAGWVMRERGDVDGTVLHDYLCPVHGRFESRVSRAEVPDEVACPLDDVTELDLIGMSAPEAYEVINSVRVCGLTSPWSPGSVAVWKSSGEVTG